MFESERKGERVIKRKGVRGEGHNVSLLLHIMVALSLHNLYLITGIGSLLPDDPGKAYCFSLRPV